MMTMRRRPLADRSRLEMWQPERHGCQQQIAWWAARLVGWYLLTAELADRAGQRRRQEVPVIVARCREALWKLAPRFCTARVLGHAASAVLPTHQRGGPAGAGGRWVVPPRWVPTANGVPSIGWNADEYCIAVVESWVYKSHNDHLECGCFHRSADLAQLTESSEALQHRSFDMRLHRQVCIKVNAEITDGPRRSDWDANDRYCSVR